MMVFDFGPVVEGLDKAGEEYRHALDIGFARAGLAMVHKFQDEQLSGRTAGDLGLNVVTGTLRDSLKSLVTTEADTVTAMVYNRGAMYWDYHQSGTDRLKKRLFFDEDWQDSGEKIFASQVDIAMDVIG